MTRGQRYLFGLIGLLLIGLSVWQLIDKRGMIVYAIIIFAFLISLLLGCVLLWVIYEEYTSEQSSHLP